MTYFCTVFVRAPSPLYAKLCMQNFKSLASAVPQIQGASQNFKVGPLPCLWGKVLWAPRVFTPNSTDPFNCFCTLNPFWAAWQTDRQTDRHGTLVCIRCSLKIIIDYANGVQFSDWWVLPLIPYKSEQITLYQFPHFTFHSTGKFCKLPVADFSHFTIAQLKGMATVHSDRSPLLTDTRDVVLSSTRTRVQIFSTRTRGWCTHSFNNGIAIFYKVNRTYKRFRGCH